MAAQDDEEEDLAIDVIVVVSHPTPLLPSKPGEVGAAIGEARIGPRPAVLPPVLRRTGRPRRHRPVVCGVAPAPGTTHATPVVRAASCIVQLAPQVPREAWPRGRTQDRRKDARPADSRSRRRERPPFGTHITPPHVMNVPVGSGVKSWREPSDNTVRKDAQAHRTLRIRHPSFLGVKPPGTKALEATPCVKTHGPQ